MGLTTPVTSRTSPCSCVYVACPPFSYPWFAGIARIHGSIVAGTGCTRAGPVLRWTRRAAAAAELQLVAGPRSRSLGPPDLAG